MTLSRPMSDGERATASYRPRSSTGLKDTDGNILAPFSAEVTTDEPAAGVTAALVSDPGDDATYAAGDTVRVRLTFFEAVEVDTTQGTPRLKLDLDSDGGSGERWAAYEGGTGTTELTFAYVASSGDMSADGVAVLADTLEPNGGAIRSVATRSAAALGHAGLDHDPAHRVDAEPPRLLRGEIDGGTMTLFFSEALDPDWTGGKFDMAVEVPEQGVTGFRAAGGVTVEGRDRDGRHGRTLPAGDCGPGSQLRALLPPGRWRRRGAARPGRQPDPDAAQVAAPQPGRHRRIAVHQDRPGQCHRDGVFGDRRGGGLGRRRRRHLRARRDHPGGGDLRRAGRGGHRRAGRRA